MSDLNNKNFSNQKGLQVENGAVIIGSNFTQNVQTKGSDVVSGNNLRFVRCTMGNVKPEPSWTLEDCNNTIFEDVQIDEDIETEPGVFQNQTKVKRQILENWTI